MLNQLLKVMTPDMIIEAIKGNPIIVMETLQKFDTFKLLGQALTPDLQVVLSNNGRLINPYLSSSEGVSAIKVWAEGFSTFVDRQKPFPEATKSSVEDSLRSELTAKIRQEILVEMRELELKKAIDSLPKKK